MTRIDRYVTMHDCGTILHPGMVDGQIRGGFAQALGAALYEEYAYAEDGSFLTGTFADYLLPTTAEVPDPVILHMETPSPFTPLGSKGVGEGNCMSTPVCIANAVADALGIKDVELPLVPAKLADIVRGAEPPPPAGRRTGMRRRAAKGGRQLRGEGSTKVAAPPEAVWAMLLDPATLQAVIPGCHGVEKISDTHFRADVTIGIGPVKGRYRAEVKLSDLDAPRAVTLGGFAEGALGFGNGEGRITLMPENAGTVVHYDYDAAIGGKVASIGGRLLDGAARVIIGQFFAGSGPSGRRCVGASPAVAAGQAARLVRGAVMKPAPFDYVRAETLDEALAVLAAEGGDARIIAGGQSLMAMLNTRLAKPKVLIDIMRLKELDRIDATAGAVTVGAGVRQQALLSWPSLAEKLKLVALALPWTGHVQTRSRGTICGSIAHADPSAEMPLVLLALGGDVHLRTAKKRRKIAAAEFFTGMMSTARADDEMIEAVSFPSARRREMRVPRSRAASRRLCDRRLRGGCQQGRRPLRRRRRGGHGRGARLAAPRWQCARRRPEFFRPRTRCAGRRPCDGTLSPRSRPADRSRPCPGGAAMTRLKSAERHRIGFKLNGAHRPRRSRTPHAVDGLSASTDRRHGHSRRMRARRLRRLHRDRGRNDHPRLPDARGADRRLRHPHRGRSRARPRSAKYPAGRFQAPSRAAMRLLHRRNPDVARSLPS